MATTTKSRSGRSSSVSPKKGSSKNTARTKTANTSRSAATKVSSKKAPAPVQPEPDSGSLFRKFATSRVAMPLIFIGAVILLTGIDLLISWNKYDMFFKILGFEILIAVVIWVILTLVFSGRKNKDTDSVPSEDEV